MAFQDTESSVIWRIGALENHQDERFDEVGKGLHKLIRFLFKPIGIASTEVSRDPVSIVAA